MEITLLIAHYNNYNYFTECYQSILQQTVNDIKIIIVDDASTDDSFQKLAALVEADSRVYLYRNETNRGVGYTKKRLVDLCETQICGFLDPDDAIAADAIETVINTYNEKKDIVGTYSQFYYCDEELNPKKIFNNTRKIRPGDRFFFNIHYEVAHFFTFSLKAYTKTEGINPELKMAEDQDLYLKLYDVGELFFIRKPLYYYRVHNHGLSHDTTKKTTSHSNWHRALAETAKRREISSLYGKKISQIGDLPTFIFKNENTILNRLRRKLF